jgi:uncharacterized protein (DUF885 family)|tara:strand:+ start:1902 stop:3593 length:1692 start_codon:yes stop_codon:yes gene_type:complete
MKLYEDFMNEYFSLAPLSATYIGINDYNDKLINYYEEPERIKYQKFLKKYISLVNQKLKLSNTEKNKHYLKVLQYRLKMDLERYKYNFHCLPIDSLHNTILNWVEHCSGKSYIPLKSMKDFKNFLSRMRVYLESIDSMINRMKDGIKNKITQPKKVMKKVLVDLENVLKNKDYLLNEYNSTKQDKIPKSVSDEYNLIIKNLFPLQIKKLSNFIQNTYLKNCHNGFGLLAFKNGKEMYNYLVRYHTTLKKPNIPEIHNLGIKEVKRIEENINQLFIKYKKIYPKLINPKKLNNLSPKDIKDIKVREKIFYKDEKDILKSFRKLQIQIDKNVLPKYFSINDKINTKYQIKRIPKFKEKNEGGAYYQRSSYDLKRLGSFFINMGKIDQIYKCNSYSLSIHEGNPGHHFQTSYSNDMKNPLFISFYEDETAYVEGWGLYAEYLGREYLLEEEKEKELLNEEQVYDLFGSYNMEMLRALRLVIDTGIHYYGWDFKKSLDYMKKYSELGEKEIENEIYRYSLYPGQALAYKIGGLKLKKMKEEAIKKGKNIKDFHHNILKYGSRPLWML